VLTAATAEQLDAHGLHVAFIAFVVVLGLVLTAAAVVDAARHRKARR
jgi:hypothetical protein